MRSFLVLCSIVLAEEIVSKTIDAGVSEADQILTGARRLKKNNKYEEAAKAAMEYTNFKSPLVDSVRKSTDPNELLRTDATDARPEGIVAAFNQNRDSSLQGHALNDEVEQANYRKVAKKGRNTDTLMGQQFRGYPTLFNSNPAFWLPGMQQPDLPYESWILPLNTQGLRNPLISGFPNGFNVPDANGVGVRPELMPLRQQQPFQRPVIMNELGNIPHQTNWVGPATTDDLYRYSQSLGFPTYLDERTYESAYPESRYINNSIPPLSQNSLDFGLPSTTDLDGGLLRPREYGAPFGIPERPLAPEFLDKYIGDGRVRARNSEYLPTLAARESVRPAKFGLDVLTPTGAELRQTPWGTPEIVPLPFSSEFVEAPLISNQINHGSAARVLPNAGGVWVSEATLPEPAFSRRSRLANLPLREPSVALPEFPMLRDTLSDQFNVDLLEE